MRLEFDKAYVDKYTGIDISSDDIEHTLTSLGFDVSREKNYFKVVVPSWRATKDVTIKADIIEEITRIYGYDNFDIFTVESPLYPIRMAEEKIDEEQIKDILVKRFGLHEIHSYIWMYYDEYKRLGIEPESNVRLLNATNPNIETIRNSIIPTQLCQLSKNIDFAPEFGVFEIGRVVKGCKEDGTCDEHKMLAITMYSRECDYEELYYRLKDVIENTLRIVKHDTLTFSAKEAKHSYQHPKNLNSIICQGKTIGEMGIVHPAVLEKINKRATIVFAEIDVKAFSELADCGIKYVEPSKYPTIEIDLSYVVDTYAPIKEAIDEAKSELIKKTEVIDIYQSSIEKSITVRIIFSNNERTLTREEVLKISDGIVENLKRKGIMLKA